MSLVAPKLTPALPGVLGLVKTTNEDVESMGTSDAYKNMRRAPACIEVIMRFTKPVAEVRLFHHRVQLELIRSASLISTLV